MLVSRMDFWSVTTLVGLLVCWLYRSSVQEKGPLRKIISVGLQRSRKRAYNQKVLLCFQTPFRYGIGKGEPSSAFCVLHYMKQVASIDGPPRDGKAFFGRWQSSLSQWREHPLMLWPDMCDNLRQILLTICHLFVKIYTTGDCQKYLALAQQC